jgi:hypothetical protein
VLVGVGRDRDRWWRSPPSPCRGRPRLPAASRSSGHLGHHPHRPLTRLRRVVVPVLKCHDSISSEDRSPNTPAIQSRRRTCPPRLWRRITISDLLICGRPCGASRCADTVSGSSRACSAPTGRYRGGCRGEGRAAAVLANIGSAGDLGFRSKPITTITSCGAPARAPPLRRCSDRTCARSRQPNFRSGVVAGSAASSG